MRERGGGRGICRENIESVYGTSVPGRLRLIVVTGCNADSAD